MIWYIALIWYIHLSIGYKAAQHAFEARVTMKNDMIYNVTLKNWYNIWCKISYVNNDIICHVQFHVYTHLQAWRRGITHTQICTCVCVCMCMCARVCACVCVCVCVCVYTFIYICTWRRGITHTQYSVKFPYNVKFLHNVKFHTYSHLHTPLSIGYNTSQHAFEARDTSSSGLVTHTHIHAHTHTHVHICVCVIPRLRVYII